MSSNFMLQLIWNHIFFLSILHSPSVLVCVPCWEFYIWSSYWMQLAVTLYINITFAIEEFSTFLPFSLASYDKRMGKWLGNHSPSKYLDFLKLYLFNFFLFSPANSDSRWVRVSTFFARATREISHSIFDHSSLDDLAVLLFDFQSKVTLHEFHPRLCCVSLNHFECPFLLKLD